MKMSALHFPEAYIEAQLELLAEGLEATTYPGYPETKDRLVSMVAVLGRTVTGALIVPEGPWIVPGNSVFRDDNLAPSTLATYNLERDGYQTDSEGRPLHPWFERMVEDPKIGVLGGRGAYWHWGPNRTADSVVIHDDSILLIQRNDTGTLALPGGFIDGGEHAARAARREVGEETHITLDNTWGIPFYKGPVVDIRMTAHAWPETTAYLFHLDPKKHRPVPLGGDDAKRAEWVAIKELPDLKLFGSHTFLARLALSQLGAVRGQAINGHPADYPAASAPLV